MLGSQRLFPVPNWLRQHHHALESTGKPPVEPNTRMEIPDTQAGIDKYRESFHEIALLDNLKGQDLDSRPDSVVVAHQGGVIEARFNPEEPATVTISSSFVPGLEAPPRKEWLFSMLDPGDFVMASVSENSVDVVTTEPKGNGAHELSATHLRETGGAFFQYLIVP